MDKRIYNKLFVGRNRDKEHEKLIFGYKYNGKDLTLAKDQETYFHMPYFIDSVKISESSLIEDGATGGPFPAASDRIFKNKKDYSNISPFGHPSDIADGVWFCSWLYKDHLGRCKWMDRFYNPGKFNYSVAVKELAESFTYSAHNPVFRDIESVMVLDPGVMYKYFHMGEKTAKELVKSFGGEDASRLRLDLQNWNSEQIDSSITPKPVSIITSGERRQVVTTSDEKSRTQKTGVNFNTTQSTEVAVDYDVSYCLENDFTLTFWAKSDNWLDSQTTQLAGNHSSAGGYGVFFDSLSSYPFLVIPETGYGHLLIFNEQGESIADKSTQTSPKLSSNPMLVAINRDNHIIFCSKDTVGSLTKTDVGGKLLDIKTGFFTPNREELPQQLLLGPNDDIVIITNKAQYVFDKQLNLKQNFEQLSSPNTVAAFKYNIKKDAVKLFVKDNTLDLKFIEEQEWSISSEDYNLYRNSVKFADFPDKATSLSVDPFNRVWVMHGPNKISIFDQYADPLTAPIKTISFNVSVFDTYKSITFFCNFDRSTNKREWKALVCFVNSPELYILNMEGIISKKIDKLSLFSASTVSIFEQLPQNFLYEGKGDFSGYEHRRVFNQLSPYRNTPQLLIKAALRENGKPEVIFGHFTASAPFTLPKTGSYHFVLTHKKQEFSLYCNSVLLTKFSYGGRYSLNFEMQPTFYIGTPGGSRFSLNTETKYTSCIFNGFISDVKVYDYCIDSTYLDIFIRDGLTAENIYWAMPSPTVQYVERVERMFKNKIPGHKSNFFNIKLYGAQIKDPSLRAKIEEEIKSIVQETKPINTELVKIYWIE